MLEIFGENVSNAFIWNAMKVPFSDFIHDMSQAPSKVLSKWIKVDKWDYLKYPSEEFDNSFCEGSYESLQRLEGKNRKVPFFKVQSGKIAVWVDIGSTNNLQLGQT